MRSARQPVKSSPDLRDYWGTMEALKEANICLRNILAVTPKPGPTIDEVLDGLARELGVTRETISEWTAGRGTVQPWQLDLLRKKARMT